MAAGDWLPAVDVLAHFKIDAASDNAAAVLAARSAAVRFVERERRDLGLEAADPADPTTAALIADVRYGALLLTGRLYARKGTPEGIAAFGELGAAVILRTDPDVAMLLGIGRFGKPGVA